MEIIVDKQGNKKKLFTVDAMPNPAFRNAFQSNEFRLSLNKIHISDDCSEINLEEAELSLKSDSDSLRVCEEKLTECE